MTKNKSASHVIACLLALMMIFSCFCVPAFALDGLDGHPNTENMQVPKEVTQVGAKAFYKIQDGIVVYADGDDGSGWTAVPSAYIQNSEYNEGNVSYGAYVVGNEVVFVAMSECYENGGKYYFSHGTKDGATVSTDVDHATNEDPSMGTDFYLRVENGIDPDGPSKEDTLHKDTSDPRVSYDITVQTKSSYQLDTTVPMYVCMYGYRGTGTVITPTSDAYQLKNYSTVNMGSQATIVDIVKRTAYTQILDKEHSDENLAAIAFNPDDGTYRWWYSMPSEEELQPLKEAGWVVNTEIADAKLNASGECYVIYIDGAWDFKAAGVLDSVELREEVTAIDSNHPLKEDFVFGEWNFGKEFKVGDSKTGGKNEGLAVKVTELQAIPATWRMVPVSTGISDIRRGELSMSIAPQSAISDASAIDLAKCSAPVDITDRGWYMEAPDLSEDGQSVKTASTLPIITSARMAGGNVNPSGCTSVVRVVYTVTPLFGIEDGQTNTSVGDAANSNRINN